MRRRFEDHGEIKTFFDLIANRGMVFVTYVSIGPDLFLWEAFFLVGYLLIEPFFSMTFEQLKEHENDCKAVRLVVDPSAKHLI